MLISLNAAGPATIEGTRAELGALLLATARALREWGPWPVKGLDHLSLTVEALDAEGRSEADAARGVAAYVVRRLTAEPARAGGER